MLHNKQKGIAKQTSNSKTTYCNIQLDKVTDKDISVCEHLGCERKGTEKIELSAGIYGTLLINVCENCIGIFKAEGGNTHDSI